MWIKEVSAPASEIIALVIFLLPLKTRQLCVQSETSIGLLMHNDIARGESPFWWSSFSLYRILGTSINLTCFLKYVFQKMPFKIDLALTSRSFYSITKL